MNDWLEKRLEDYIVANPRTVSEQILDYDDDYEVSTLGRQVRCQYGIIDVLLWVHGPEHNLLLVVECKAKHERGLAIEQVERYIASVQSIARIQDVRLGAIPVIVAPSFDKRIVSTYDGILIAAQQIDNGFNLKRAFEWKPSSNDHLISVLGPVIQRAQRDAAAREIRDAMSYIPDTTPLFSLN